jgi:hypothetical protein
MVVHTYNLNYSGGGDRRIASLRTAWAKSARPYQNENKRAGSMTQVGASSYQLGGPRSISTTTEGKKIIIIHRLRENICLAYI